MVCLGNICRSPLAQGILGSKLSSDFTVDSAGTAAYHIGNPPDIRSISVAKEHGIDISKQSARQFSMGDFDKFDKIYVMDKSNYDTITSLTNNKDHLQKVSLILDELPLMKLQEVPDPYYGNENDFLEVYQILDKASEVIASKLV